jgi:hypothetical protein
MASTMSLHALFSANLMGLRGSSQTKNSGKKFRDFSRKIAP